MTSNETGASSADERTHVAALLAHYPQLHQDELDQVHQWFRKGASALDLGLLASDPAIATQYRAYRAEHYDRITSADLARAAAFIGIAVGFLILIVMLMP